MVSLRKKFFASEFYRIFNFKNELAVGSTMLLFNTFMVNILNVFITGVFYTGFLTYSGIDIVRVGIIAFIPYITWIFSLFSPIIYSKVKNRRALLLFNHIFYYTCVVVATTIIPLFVTDEGARTLWFGVFLFLGNTSNALFASGITAWHMHFLPEGYDRNVFFAYINLIGSFVGTFAAIFSSVIIDSFSAVQQGELIVLLRYIAAALFIVVGLLLFLIPREYPYKETHQKIKISQIFSVPIQSKKFITTALFVILWNLIANVNAGTWNFYVMNTVGITYTEMNIGAAVMAIGGIFLTRNWRLAIIRYSTFSIIFVTVLVSGLLEAFIAFTTAETKWVFIVASILQGLIAIGRNLVFANLFFINLPQGNTDIYITFWNFTTNISILVGSVFGTWFIAFFERFEPVALFGLPFYGSQFLVLIKFLLFMLLCVFLYTYRDRIQPDDECGNRFTMLGRSRRSRALKS